MIGRNVWALVVGLSGEHLGSMREALGSISSTEKKKGTKEGGGGRKAATLSPTQAFSNGLGPALARRAPDRSVPVCFTRACGVPGVHSPHQGTRVPSFLWPPRCPEPQPFRHSPGSPPHSRPGRQHGRSPIHRDGDRGAGTGGLHLSAPGLPRGHAPGQRPGQSQGRRKGDGTRQETNADAEAGLFSLS